MEIWTEKKAEDFLEKRGFPVVKRKIVKNIQQAKEFSKKLYPVVLKDPSKLHKTESNAVIINTTENNIEENYKNLRAKEVLVQKQGEGIEIILGLKKDPTFGHIVLLGMGGIYTELIKDTSIRICPIDEDEADKMIKELKGYKILKGIRNKKPINFKALRKIITKLSEIPLTYRAIRELDINPLFANNKEVLIADARAILD